MTREPDDAPAAQPRPETAGPAESAAPQAEPGPVKVIPDPGFADDDGAADVALARALGREATGEASAVEVLAALQDARLLVPVVATVGEVEIDENGLARDKTSDMAAVLVRGADGRTGLLAFSSVETLQRWDPDARPVPVTTSTAATAALQDGAAALLVDLAGPAPYVLSGDTLARLAAGWRVVGVGEDAGWIGPGTS